MSVTYQLRIHDSAAVQVLDRLGEFLAPITRRTLVEAQKGIKPSKSEIHKKYDIPNRYGYAIKTDVEARLLSRLECLKAEVVDLQSKLEFLPPKIAKSKFPEQKKKWKRQLRKLSSRLKHRQQQLAVEDFSYIFGGKDLWLAQFHLKENGYASHQEWLEDWRLHRNYNFNIIGSKDELGGNQNCQFLPKSETAFDLKLRLPDGFLVDGEAKYLIISGLEISQRELAKNAKRGLSYGWSLIRDLLREGTSGVSYRFHKDRKGWILSATVDYPEVIPTTNSFFGVIGIDVNYDFLALTETDASGNPIAWKHIQLGLVGLSTEARENRISHVVLEAVTYAKERGKDLVVEYLDFQQKKRELVVCYDPGYARMLSSFSYRNILDRIQSSAYVRGVGVHQVNPAYSSIIGRFKFSSRYGMSVHQAAALVIARRYLGFSERLPQLVRAYLYQAGRIQVTLGKPVDSPKHVWSRWGKLLGQIRKLWSSKPKRAKDPKLRDPQETVQVGLLRAMVTSPTLDSKATMSAVALGGYHEGDK
jgi:IS605 OrfB family transposase